MIQLRIGDSMRVYFFKNRSSDFSLNTTLQEDIRTCEPFEFSDFPWLIAT